jgi:glycosyltransferase involved in cell wall biosynthesis
MILLISSVFPPEPVVSALIGFDLANALSEHQSITVISPRPSRPSGFSFHLESKNNIAFTHLILNSYTCPESKLFGRMRESFSFGKHAANFIRRNHREIDCIYVHAWPLFAQYLIIRASKKYQLPTVTHVVDIYPETLLNRLPVLKSFFYHLLLPLDRYTHQHSSRIVTISPRMKDLLVKTRKLESQKVEVIYNWQNEEVFSTIRNTADERQRSERFTFMFLGNLSRTAAIHILITAFAESRLKKSRLVIAGSGSEKEALVSLANQFQDAVIEFWDAAMNEVPAIQNEADVLLLSLKKGVAQFALPSKIPAYLFSAKPVIACVEENSDTADTIKQARCGWVVQPENAGLLSETMIKVTELSKIYLQQLGMNGFQYAVKNFSKNNNLMKFVNLIQDTVKV